MDTNNSIGLIQNQNSLFVPDTTFGNGWSQDPYALGLNTSGAKTALHDPSASIGYFGSNNDVIDLGNSSNTIFAGDGNNVVLGGLGINEIFSGSGRDIIDMGDGNSTIFAGDGINLITTGYGKDLIYAGADRDFINAGDGKNTIFAGDGDNHILTGKGNDLIFTGVGNDAIYSGAGNDKIVAGDGNNVINAGTGNDTVSLGSGNNKIILEAGKGAVTIIGFDSATDKLRLGESLLGKSLTFVTKGSDTLVMSGKDFVATLKGVSSGSQALIDSGPLFRYEATDLGSLSIDPNGAVNAASINDFGQVAGRYNTGETFTNQNATTGVTQTVNVRQGFIWENGTQMALTSTGVKDGQSDFGAADGVTVTLLTPNVNTIGNRGVVLGTGDEVRQPSPKATDRALLWQDDGSGYQLTINDFGGVESYYLDTNNRNQISGRNIVSENDAQGTAQTFERPLFIENGEVTRLADVGGNGGTAQSLNGKGDVVGYLDSDGVLDSSEKYTAVVWKRDASGEYILQDLGTFGAEQARATDINNAGYIIGASSNGTGATETSTPFLLRDGVLTTLGSLGGKTGSANEINEFGQVVGASQIASGTNHAYVWDGGVQSDLNSLVTKPLTYNGAVVTLTGGTSINNFGEIVATGTYTYKDPVTNLDTTGTRSFILKAV
jgi:probable HAF family extracellular repeat protein